MIVTSSSLSVEFVSIFNDFMQLFHRKKVKHGKTQSQVDLSNAFWYFTGALILIIIAGKRS